MRRAPCAGLAERRSAFVDGALSDTDRDRLLVHLAGCLSCRADVQGLRAVRDLVSRTTEQPAAEAPADLSQRLVSIAGDRSDAPVWTRDRHRRTARIRAAVGGAAVVVTVAVAGGAGYAAAPPGLTAVADPAGEAGVEFTSALDQFPLITGSLGAVMSADPAALLSTVAAPTTPQSSVATGGPVTATEAQAALHRAADASDTVSYRGVQRVLAHTPSQTVGAQVDVVGYPGRGLGVRVSTLGAVELGQTFVPATSGSRTNGGELLSLLARNYALSGIRGAQVAGRSATMLEARHGGSLVARWWVDDASGILLWQENYDDEGAVRISAGFTEVTVSDRPLDFAPSVASVRLPTTNVALTLSNVVPLAASGWACHRDLGNLSLVKLRADRTADPTAVHLVYSDGLNTVAVYEQHGRLANGPAGSVWDDTIGAHVLHGASSLATWQSGDRVFTVMTNGSADQLTRAVDLLPHEAPLEPTTLERVQAGWSKILADMKG